MLQLAFWLVASHALCDFALQPTPMARGKSRRHAVILPRDQRHEPTWIDWLLAHSMIHGAGVAGALTLVGRPDLWWLGLGELVLHAAIDYLKADRRITMAADQALHLACKALWLATAVLLPA
jgi:hypothetical protein